MKTEPTCLPQVGSFFIGVSMNGWIKFHKKTIENEMWRNDRTAWHIFEGLLMIVKTETGSWSGGRLQMSQLFGIKDTTIYKALLRLQKANMVTLSSNNKFSTIHICNWKKYQAVSNNASNNKVTTKGQQSNTLKRNKETKETKKATLEQAPNPVSKLYYQYLKKYRIPVRNHKTLAGKIKEMESLNGTDWSVRYLTFMLTEYESLQVNFKPEITESLDLYNKSKKIETLLEANKTKQEIY